jgi:hypothetical protein
MLVNGQKKRALIPIWNKSPSLRSARLTEDDLPPKQDDDKQDYRDDQ